MTLLSCLQCLRPKAWVQTDVQKRDVAKTEETLVKIHEALIQSAALDETESTLHEPQKEKNYSIYWEFSKIISRL